MNARISISSFLLLALLLAACGAPPSVNVVETVVVAEMGQSIVIAATPAGIPRPTEAPLAPYPASTAVKEGEPRPVAFKADAGRMIIKDAVIEILVQDTDRAIDQVTQLTSDQGGYILSSRSWYNGEYKLAEIRMGIPSAAFENTLTYLRRMGIQVLSETASGQDVSAEYTDLESRLTNLEATAARTRQLLDRAMDVEDALRISQTLSELEGQIEQIKGQMRFYEGRSAYSTITITLTPQMPTPTPTTTPTPTPMPTVWSPSATIGKASNVMVRMLQGIVDLVIWTILLTWPFVLVGVIALLIARRMLRKPPKASKPQGD